MRSEVARTLAAKVYSRTEGIVGRGVRPLGPAHLEQSALRLARRERRLDGVLVHLSVSRVARLLCESSGRRERGRSREHLGDVPALPADRLHDRRRAMPPAILPFLLAE